MNELEQRLLQFVAEQTGVKAEKLTLSTRLLHDIQMDGDDATEFYEAYSKEFGVSLEQLGEKWSDYFGSEAGSWQDVGLGELLMFATIAGLLAAPISISWLLAHKMSVTPILQWVIGAVLFIVLCSCELWVWAAVQRKNDDVRYAPMTIEDLVNGARSGTLQAPGKLPQMLPNDLQPDRNQH